MRLKYIIILPLILAGIRAFSAEQEVIPCAVQTGDGHLQINITRESGVPVSASMKFWQGQGVIFHSEMICQQSASGDYWCQEDSNVLGHPSLQRVVVGHLNYMNRFVTLHERSLLNGTEMSGRIACIIP